MKKVSFDQIGTGTLPAFKACLFYGVCIHVKYVNVTTWNRFVSVLKFIRITIPESEASTEKLNHLN